MNEEQFTKGFNAGYLTSKYESDLVKPILKAQGKSDFLDGFTLGHKQNLKEQFLEQAHEKRRGRSR